MNTKKALNYTHASLDLNMRPAVGCLSKLLNYEIMNADNYLKVPCII